MRTGPGWSTVGLGAPLWSLDVTLAHLCFLAIAEDLRMPSSVSVRRRVGETANGEGLVFLFIARQTRGLGAEADRGRGVYRLTLGSLSIR